MEDLGVYVHIPFCKQKCLYCDFTSFAGNEKIQDTYIQALLKEITNWKKQNKDYSIETIYIGGGTPSYIDSKYIIEIVKMIKDFNKKSIEKDNNISITIEVNPGTVTKEKLEDYKTAGINRISIGLQSCKDRLLREIGRIHDYEDFLETFSLARHLGFDNINVDLMIGLPNQTIMDIKDSLERLIELNPEHISVYSLILEDDTIMKKMVEEGVLILPDEEIERQMYWYVKDFLELHGYKHYEISNFAKPGFESQHNMNCWEQKEYIGFGIAAHSYIEDKRFCNISDMEKYIQNCNNGNFEDNKIILEIQNREDKINEYMILGLRKIEGVSIQEFENIFNENPIMVFRKELQKLNNEGLILIDGDKIKLSNRGLDFANLVWEEFV